MICVYCKTEIREDESRFVRDYLDPADMKTILKSAAAHPECSRFRLPSREDNKRKMDEWLSQT